MRNAFFKLVFVVIALTTSYFSTKGQSAELSVSRGSVVKNIP